MEDSVFGVDGDEVLELRRRRRSCCSFEKCESEILESIKPKCMWQGEI